MFDNVLNFQVLGASLLSNPAPLTQLSTMWMTTRNACAFWRARASAGGPGPQPERVPVPPWHGGGAEQRRTTLVHRRMGALYAAIASAGLGALVAFIGVTLLRGKSVDSTVTMALAMFALAVVASCCVAAALVTVVWERRLEEDLRR